MSKSDNDTKITLKGERAATGGYLAQYDIFAIGKEQGDGYLFHTNKKGREAQVASHHRRQSDTKCIYDRGLCSPCQGLSRIGTFV